MKDERTSEQAEDVADRLFEEAEKATETEEAQRLRDEAIFTMLRAILLQLRAQEREP